MKNGILMAVNTQIQRLQNNLHKAQSDLTSQIALEVQPVSYVLKRKETSNNSSSLRRWSSQTYQPSKR